LQARRLVGPEVAEEFFLHQRPERAGVMQGIAGAPLQGIFAQGQEAHVAMVSSASASAWESRTMRAGV
jgi:hypothetical protein